MGVPAHDTRDYKFAKNFNLPIKKVIRPFNEKDEECYTGEGILINSGDFGGLTTIEARKAITEFGKKHFFATSTVQYKLKDWLISRQRYWGCPIPIIHCPNCGVSNNYFFFKKK